jgi:hemerythrin
MAVDPGRPDFAFSAGRDGERGGPSEMEPEGTSSRRPPGGPDEPILARIERDHRQIVNFYLTELAAAQEPSRIRELLDPLPEMLSKHFADEEGPEGLYDGLRAIRPSLDPELKSLRGEHRSVLKAAEELRKEMREIEQLGRAENQAERLARTREDLFGFMEMVRRHERAETRLVADTYYLEEGGSG